MQGDRAQARPLALRAQIGPPVAPPLGDGGLYEFSNRCGRRVVVLFLRLDFDSLQFGMLFFEN